jgi:lactoylglutathione lyase
MSGTKKYRGISFRVRHAMLAVKDVDRSVDFYTRYFGMDVQRERATSALSPRTTYVGYGSDDENFGIELVQSDTDGHEKPWTGHLAIYVSDLRLLCVTLKAAGVKFLQEPAPMRPDGPDLVAFIEDVDGYVLELTERHTLTGPPVRVT